MPRLLVPFDGSQSLMRALRQPVSVAMRVVDLTRVPVTSVR